MTQQLRLKKNLLLLEQRIFLNVNETSRHFSKNNLLINPDKTAMFETEWTLVKYYVGK